jgi:hypothetical protein
MHDTMKKPRHKTPSAAKRARPSCGSPRAMAAQYFKTGRFIRILKEQLLWLDRFRTVAELGQALRDFARRFNNHWIIGRIGYRTPAAHRRILLGEAA